MKVKVTGNKPNWKNHGIPLDTEVEVIYKSGTDLVVKYERGSQTLLSGEYEVVENDANT